MKKLIITAIKHKGGIAAQEIEMQNSEIQYRAFSLDKAATKADQREVAVSFSSEEPCGRWFGVEVLSHDPAAVDLGRLNKGGAVLLDHDPSAMVAVVKKAWVDTNAKKARAVIKFSKSPRGEEVWQDVCDGIRQSFSVGYRVHKYEEETTDSGDTVYRAVAWEPHEISSVSVPMDVSVGVNRSIGDGKMTEKNDIKVFENLGAKAERARIREIQAYGQQFNCSVEASRAVDDGTSIDTFRKYVLKNHLPETTPVETDGELGLTEKETRQFKFVDAIRCLSDSKFAQSRRGGFIIESSRATAQKLGKEARGVLVPPEVLTRDLTVGTDSAGGYTVATNLMAQNFIELLRNKLVVVRAGAKVLSGLLGDVTIPKLTGAATGNWFDSDGSGSITESQESFGQVSLAPRTVGGLVQMSHKLLIQSSPEIETLVRSDLASVLATAIDLAAISGTGANNQPTGILATSGINSNSYANGSDPDYDDVLTLEADVAGGNAESRGCCYMTNSALRKTFKQIFANATYGTDPLWTSLPDGDGLLNGHRAFCSEQLSSGYLLYGDFTQLLIGQWSAVELLSDPFTGFASGTVSVRALSDVDIAIRHPGGFSEVHEAAS